MSLGLFYYLIFFRSGMFVKMPEQYESPWKSFLMPFTCGIWLCICATIPLIVLCLSITEKYRRYFKPRPVTLIPSEVLFHIFGVFSYQGKKYIILSDFF